MTDRFPDHRSHDLLLVAAYAAGDVEGAERERAEALVASCRECTALAADLRAIAAALPSASVPRRPRDFRLRQADLAPARRSPLLDLVGGLGALRRSLAPVGAGLATIGIAGLLLAGTTWLLGGSTATILSTVGSSVSSDYGPRDAAGGASSSAPSPASSGAPVPAYGASGGGQGASGGGLLQSIPPEKAVSPEEAGPVPSPQPPSGPSPLVTASVVLLVVGVVALGVGRLVRSRGSPSE